jgi:catechol 2,3-dioxygenase-like lactoylglutathione lyase family enzyme
MNFNPLIPELSAVSLERSVWFYVNVLGFQIDYQRPEHKFVFLSYQNIQLMVGQISRVSKTAPLEYPFGRGINMQMIVDDIDVLISALKLHRYPLILEPEEHWYRRDNQLLGLKEFLVLDPDGYVLRFSQQIGTRPLENQDASA